MTTKPDNTNEFERKWLVDILTEAMEPHDYSVEDPTPHQVADTLITAHEKAKAEAVKTQVKAIINFINVYGATGSSANETLKALMPELYDRLKELTTEGEK